MTQMLGVWLHNRPGDEKLEIGSIFEQDGISFRIEPGNRCEGDRVISIKTNGWIKPSLSLMFILMRFKGGVEENNYGPGGKVKVGSGWKYLIWRIHDVSIQGWEWAVNRTKDEVKKRTNYD